jgi:hypothetical protein
MRMLLQGKRCSLRHSLARRDALMAKALLFQKSLGMHIGAERGWKWEEGVGVGGGGEGMGGLGGCLEGKGKPGTDAAQRVRRASLLALLCHRHVANMQRRHKIHGAAAGLRGR